MSCRPGKPTFALLFSIFLALALPVVAMWYYTSHSQEKTIIKSMTFEKAYKLEILASTLAAPLWDYREDKIKAISDSYINHPHVKKVVVYDAIIDKVAYESKDTFCSGEITIGGSRDIVHNGKKIGSVYLEINSKAYEDDLGNRNGLLFVLFILELCISFALVTYAVYRFILFPLNKRTEMVKTGSGSEPACGIFDHSIEKLNSNIVNILDELKQYNDIIDDNVIIFKLDGSCVITYATSAACKTTGYTLEKLVYSHLDKITAENSCEDLEKVSSCDGNRSIVLKCERPDGEFYWLNCVIRSDKGGIMLVCEDITRKMEIEKQANTDELTGLFNRRSIREVLDKQDELFRRYSTPYSLLIIDIDHFKSVNDTHGHDVGDDTLALFAKLLSDNIRKTDYVARWGGEEFVVVCASTTLDNSVQVAEFIKDKVESAQFPTVGKVTCSIGISGAKDGLSIQRVFTKADKALYDAKESGRNKIVFSD